MSKAQRHKAILDIISSNDISKQSDIAEALKSRGFNITQATVSRDIKDLSLVKVPGKSGYKYDVPENIKDKGKTPRELLYGMLSEAVLSINFAQNIVVIKCFSGMAQAVCAKLDNVKFDSVVGTLAGDDTIFMLLKSEQLAIETVNKLNNILLGQVD